jgi:hypothetical protein
MVKPVFVGFLIFMVYAVGLLAYCLYVAGDMQERVFHGDHSPSLKLHSINDACSFLKRVFVVLSLSLFTKLLEVCVYET